MYETSIKTEGDKRRLFINFKGSNLIPDVARYPEVMRLVIEKLRDFDADELVLSEYYDHIYDVDKTKLLVEISTLVQTFENEGIWTPSKLGGGSSEHVNRISKRMTQITNVMTLLPADPYLAYRRLKTLHETEEKTANANDPDYKVFSETLEYMINSLEQVKLIKLIDATNSQLQEKDLTRTIYGGIFDSGIKPAFIGSRLVSDTSRMTLVDQYSIYGADVYLYKHPEKIELQYYINIPEFTLSPEHYFLLEKTKQIVADQRPSTVGFMDAAQARKYFNKIYLSTIADLAAKNNIKLTITEKEELARIVSRYTIGYGILEILLSDRKLTDIYIDSPIGEKPIYVVHSEYGQCQTNILYSDEEARSIVSKIRALSGRAFDEAHPILDYDLPDLQTRVAIIGKPLALDGIAFAFRLHKETPWTLCQFLDNKMLDKFTAGLLSTLIDAQASSLIVGSRGSGKTSILQSLMQEIPQNLRILVQEDSVTSDSRIACEINGKIRNTTVGSLIDSLMSDYGYSNFNGRHVLSLPDELLKVFSMNLLGKMNLSQVKQVIRHKVSKPIYEVETNSGRKIKVTSDHSLFTLNDEGLIDPIKTSELKIGSHIAIPRLLPFHSKQLIEFNSLSFLLQTNGFLCSPLLKEWIAYNWDKVKKIAFKNGYTKSSFSGWKKKSLIPIKIYNELLNEIKGIPEEKLFFKLESTSKPIPVKIKITDDFLTFVGLWLADGSYDSKYAAILSVVSPEERIVVERVASTLGLQVRMHSDGISRMISNTNLVWFLKNIAGLNGNAYTKKVPEWIFNSSKPQLNFFLKGLFSGDGYVAKNELTLTSASCELIKAVESLLLFYGIVSRTHYTVRDKCYHLRFGQNDFVTKFKEIGLLQNYKQENFENLCNRKSTHTVLDYIPFSLNFKQKIAVSTRNFNKNDYIHRQNNIGRIKLQNLSIQCRNSTLTKHLFDLSTTDIFWDEIKSITKSELTDINVYDFSVPNGQSFVCENIIAKNTQEIPVPQLKKYGFSIERMKTRPPLGAVSESEVSAEDALRTALRLGDSVLIVGEVRSSIRGNEEVLVVEKGITKRLPIASLEGKNIQNYLIPTLGFDLKMSLQPLAGFVKHPKRKTLFEVTTKTGRKITVTPDHSLFTASKDFRITAIECDKLNVGSQIVIPSSIPYGYNDYEELNVIDLLPEFRLENYEIPVRESIKKLGYVEATKFAGLTSGDIYLYFRNESQHNNIPISGFSKLMEEAEIQADLHSLRVTRGSGNSIPAIIPVNEEFCKFLGYYISEGYYHLNEGKGGSVILTNSDPKILKDMITIGKNLFGLIPLFRDVKGVAVSYQVLFTSVPLATLFSRLNCGRICTEKRVPELVYGLSKPKIASFLRGLYDGDGCFTASPGSGNSVRYNTTSKKLAEDVSYLLLAFGIVGKIYAPKPPKIGNQMWVVEFKDREMVKKFLSEIGFSKYPTKMIVKAWAHNKQNTVYFDETALKENLKYPRKYRHLKRFLKCSKNYLTKVVNDPECVPSERLKLFTQGQFFLDEIKEIKKVELEESEFVYDLSVSPSQNFVAGFGGLIAHNTEAKALYEAMRVGAVGNVVMGTIHGESAFSIWDRVVNDLGVPTTSFKATDFCIVAAPVRFKGSLRRYRRIIQITEVLKGWTKDPQEEHGFIDWLTFDANKDQLIFNEKEVFEKSEWLKKIFTNRGLNREAVFKEINARGEYKWFLVEQKRKNNLPELLEATNTIRAHNKFALMEEDYRNANNGNLDHNAVLSEWKKWVLETLIQPLIEAKVK